MREDKSPGVKLVAYLGLSMFASLLLLFIYYYYSTRRFLSLRKVICAEEGEFILLYATLSECA